MTQEPTPTFGYVAPHQRTASSPPQEPTPLTGTKYRKKPVVIEAIQYTGKNIGEIWDSFGAAWIYGPVEDVTSAFIDTLEGRMECRIGDWIIRGVQGELYPCKNDVFVLTYEPADV